MPGRDLLAAHWITGGPPGGEAPGCRFLFWGSHSALRARAPGDWLAHHRYLVPDAGEGGVVGGRAERRYTGPVRGQALYRDGEILLAVYGGEMRGCVQLASGDAGETWRRCGVIAANEADGTVYQEPALCSDPAGGLVCFMRTARAEGRLATARSDDCVHWETPRLHALTGHPFHPLPLADGRILLSYGYRQPPYGIRARLLDDAWTDPDSVPEIVIRDDGPGPDLGYPWAVQLRDGRVLVAYYWTHADGTRLIAASLLEYEV